MSHSPEYFHIPFSLILIQPYEVESVIPILWMRKLRYKGQQRTKSCHYSNWQNVDLGQEV